MKQFCTFHIDQSYLGIEVEHVQEVIRYQTMTRVPLSPTTISGLINLRGQIVTALDLRQRLGLAARADGEFPMNVVVRDEENCVSLLVDRIGDVVEVDDDLFEPPPLTVSPETRDLVRGTYKLDDQLLLILNPDRVLSEEKQINSTDAALSC